MAKSDSTSKVAIVRDLEIYWANVYKPHSPFGTEIYDIQVRTTDEDKVKELADLGITLKKHDDGYFFGNVKRKTVNAKGEPMDGPTVLDAAKAQLKDPIGNGSKGNIKVFSYEYKVGNKAGTAAMLSALQITDLVPYADSNSEVDFDVETDEPTF